MSKKVLFYSATAITVVSVGGYLVYKHLVPRAVEEYVARQIEKDEFEDSLRRQEKDELRRYEEKEASRG